MKPLEDFAKKLNVKLELNPKLIAKQKNRYYLLNSTLRQLAKPNFFHAGTYLGKTKNSKFYPSLNLLQLIAEQKSANKSTVNPKAEWLFVCGRDILRKGIIKIHGLEKKNTYTLIQNLHNENLGYGRITSNTTIRNILDIGDFLRREKSN